MNEGAIQRSVETVEPAHSSLRVPVGALSGPLLDSDVVSFYRALLCSLIPSSYFGLPYFGLRSL